MSQGQLPDRSLAYVKARRQAWAWRLRGAERKFRQREENLLPTLTKKSFSISHFLGQQPLFHLRKSDPSLPGATVSSPLWGGDLGTVPCYSPAGLEGGRGTRHGGSYS